MLQLTGGYMRRYDTNLQSAPDYKYTYPNPPGPLKPGTELHDRLRQEIMVRAIYARNQLSNRFPIWEETDKKCTTYIDLSTEEQRMKELDPKKPASVVVPVMYAARETIMAYMSSVFLDSPIIRYEGVDSSDVMGAMLLELVVNKQLDRFRGALVLYSMMQNAFTYGVGLCTPVWTTLSGSETVRAKQGFFGKLVGRQDTSYERKNVLFEGNKLELVDTYKWLPDPNHAVQDLQFSEFQGWVMRESLSSILTRERSGVGNFINGQYVKHIDGRSMLGSNQSGRDMSGVDGTVATDLVKPVDSIYMHIKLIPADWKLGKSRYPEVWQFVLAGDAVITLAEPVKYNHGMIPLVASAPDFDGHSPAPLAKLETVYGMQVLADFLENSHIIERRQSINGTIVYDPMQINSADLDSPVPGKKIRTRRKAWGKGVKDAITMLDFGDATRDHIAEINGLSSWVHMAVGSESILRGVPIQGRDRVTAQEYSGTRSSALQRLEKDARVTAYMALWDLSFMLAKNTQQFMSQDVLVRIAGRHINELQNVFQQAVRVDPLSVSVDFDIDIASYGVPAAGNPEVWGAVFKTVAESPVLSQRIDVVRMFQHWARIAGAKNISQFVLPQGNTATVMPDETVLREAEKGNIIPMQNGGTA